jgi:hypothetical protein
MAFDKGKVVGPKHNPENHPASDLEAGNSAAGHTDDTARNSATWDTNDTGHFDDIDCLG